ncbi:MAG: hypothetical protein ACLU41_10975 [Anaerotignum lactatifermentans]
MAHLLYGSAQTECVRLPYDAPLVRAYLSKSCDATDLLLAGKG